MRFQSTDVAQAPHLLQDGIARYVLPLPHFLDELLAAERAAIDSLGFQLPLDDDLRRDAGVVGARQPQRVEPAHAVIASQRIHDRLLERVAHVQDAGAIWRRQLDRKRRLARVGAGLKITARFP